MRFTFRARLLAIVGTMAIAFGAIVLASSIVSSRVARQLSVVQERYIPRVELGPRLVADLERLSRGFQDASAARDLDTLAQTRRFKEAFLADLAAAGKALDERTTSNLQQSLEAYDAAAYDVTRRMIAGEEGEALVESIGTMQTRHNRVREVLEQATTFDRGELSAAFAAATQAELTGSRIRTLVAIACLAVAMLLAAWLSRGLLRSMASLTTGLQRFGTGDFDAPIATVGRDELADVARQANEMARSLKRVADERQRSDWLKGGLSGLASELRGDFSPARTAERATAFLARYLEAPAGALYEVDGDTLRMLGHYSLQGAGGDAGPTPTFRRGEGLVGAAAGRHELTVIPDPPPSYLRIRSGLGEASPSTIAFLPLVHSNEVIGVLELCLFRPWSEGLAELLIAARESIAVALTTARARATTQRLLIESQALATRLANQEDELRATNEELQTQQDELRQTNAELAAQTEELENQRRLLEARNVELDDARAGLEHKADELATVSAYKSQFLTNMSHELRTPLNSMLLLSNLLAENESKHLSEREVEFAKTIHSAGRDLLALINQVLDLAKVEAGKQELRFDNVDLAAVAEKLRRVFEPMARDRKLAFEVNLEPAVPEQIITDPQRLEQILTNLLGNALKFTQQGKVALRVFPVTGAARTVAFAVSDTGAGIAPEDMARVFAPFEQLDSRTDRRFGGTGLGLSIARELAHLLGGKLELQSKVGVGSTFTCFVPVEPPLPTADPVLAPPAPDRDSPRAEIADDRATLKPGDPYLLIIEDDRVFAETFGDVIRNQGLKFRVAGDGTTGLRIAREHRPTGIILDVKLPELDGFAVMERLRADPEIRSVPVHFVSAFDDAERGMAMGAIGYLTKPAGRRDLIRVVESLVPPLSGRPARVLLVEDDRLVGESILRQLSGERLEARQAGSAEDALAILETERFDCLILDLSLPDMNGVALLKTLEERSKGPMPSVVVYTARALTKAETQQLEAYADAIVVKEGHSSERLLNEVRLFARRLKEGMPPRSGLPVVGPAANVRLDGKKILLADDDMRTVYALSATLRSKGAHVLIADTGRAAIAALEEDPDTDVVLMDIMMPEMDGYEAIRRIRLQERFRQLPIVALTAKAMKGDAEKCLDVGASDYMSKPIDAARLLDLIDSTLSAATAARGG